MNHSFITMIVEIAEIQTCTCFWRTAGAHMGWHSGKVGMGDLVRLVFFVPKRVLTFQYFVCTNTHMWECVCVFVVLHCVCWY